MPPRFFEQLGEKGSLLAVLIQDVRDGLADWIIAGIWSRASLWLVAHTSLSVSMAG
jgi:hypothetical protein